MIRAEGMIAATMALPPSKKRASAAQDDQRAEACGVRASTHHCIEDDVGPRGGQDAGEIAAHGFQGITFALDLAPRPHTEQAQKRDRWTPALQGMLEKEG